MASRSRNISFKSKNPSYFFKYNIYEFVLAITKSIQRNCCNLLYIENRDRFDSIIPRQSCTGLSEPGVPGVPWHPPDFGRSDNPISTMGGQLMLATLLLVPPGFSDLPTALLQLLRLELWARSLITRNPVWVLWDYSHPSLSGEIQYNFPMTAFQ